MENPSKRPTLKELAKAAGVSLASASYAVNGTGSVSPKTRAHVLKTAEEIGYQPNQLARAMKTGRSQVLGLILPDLTNPFFPNLALSIIQNARQHGYDVLLNDADGSQGREPHAIELMTHRGVDGIIWFPTVEYDVNLSLLRSPPIVILDRNFPSFDLILADYRQGGRLAAKHLIDLGHQRIGIVSGPRVAWSANERALAAEDYVKSHAELIWHVENDYSTDIESQVEQVLNEDVTAIIVGSDIIAVGLIRSLRRKGLRVPEDISVIGFDDIPWAELNTPTLSTIEMPIEDMAHAAVETVLKRIEDPDGKRYRIVFDVDLIQRESTSAI